MFSSRLGLERGETAQQGLDIITALLDAHGQGGPCTPNPSTALEGWGSNSFMICDRSEAWVLETTGKSHWAAEKVTSRYILPGYLPLSLHSLASGPNLPTFRLCHTEPCFRTQSPYISPLPYRALLQDPTSPHFTSAIQGPVSPHFISGILSLASGPSLPTFHLCHSEPCFRTQPPYISPLQFRALLQDPISLYFTFATTTFLDTSIPYAIFIYLVTCFFFKGITYFSSIHQSCEAMFSQKIVLKKFSGCVSVTPLVSLQFFYISENVFE